MINGAHVLLYSDNAEADRAFFRDVLEFPSVDVGHGWLIFALPPAEVAIHPTMEHDKHGGPELAGAVLYLMCDDLTSMMQKLQAKNVICTPVEAAPWGMKTSFPLPSGGEIGLYEPSHPTAVNLRTK